MNKNWPTNKEITTCKKIMQKGNKDLFFATLFLPTKARQASYVIYAFCKTPHNIVDITFQNKPDLAFAELTKWTESWEKAHENEFSSNLILSATSKIHKYYHIPIKYSRSYLKAFKQDLNKNYYKTSEELQNYIYGSAKVIGIILAYIIGEKNRRIPDQKILDTAEIFASAIQLTSFLKNIDSDISIKNRIYLPQIELEKFGLSHQLIKQKRYTKNWLIFMHNQINNCHSLYNTATKNITLINKTSKFALTLTSNIYRHYLKLIIDSEYKVYHNKYEHSFFSRIKILIQTITK